MSLSRNSCDTFWSLKRKIKIATATFVRDKNIKGFKIHNGKFLQTFPDFKNPFLKAKEAFLGVVSLL
jgi:hypothetical protein